MFRITLFSDCLFLNSKVLVVFAENGSSKCMLPAGTVEHLQYPPTGAYDIEHRSQDLVCCQTCYMTGRQGEGTFHKHMQQCRFAQG